jgi:hypothetical protein
MAGGFVSYARKDKGFVLRLHAALETAGRDSWVDWQDIPLTAEFKKEIFAGIESADDFLFVISPDSCASKICLEELDHAVGHNKRLIPVSYREVDPSSVPEPLGGSTGLFYATTRFFIRISQACSGPSTPTWTGCAPARGCLCAPSIGRIDIVMRVSSCAARILLPP